MGCGDLAIPPGEFWSLTVRELWALLARKRVAHERADYRAGTIAAAVMNTLRTKAEDHFFDPSDFFPNLPHYEAPEPEPSEVFDKFMGILGDIGMKRARKPSAPVARPLLTAVPLSMREAIEAKLRSLDP